MQRTIALLIIFIILLVSYLLFYNFRRRKMEETKKSQTVIEGKETTENGNSNSKENDDECCGQHEVCEKDSLINIRIKAEYYEDEELDRFRHREASSYTAEEIKEFEEVFYTLKEHEITGWLKSLQIREIEIPLNIREEALLIIQERRYNSSQQ